MKKENCTEDQLPIRLEVAPTQPPVTELIDPIILDSELGQYVEGYKNYVIPTLKENGMVNTVEGQIAPIGNGDYGAFIPGIPIIPGMINPAPTLLVNTINNGFRMASVTNDGNHTIDVAPACYPMIIGNVRRPSALYVPINKEAIGITIDFLKDIIELEKNNLKSKLEESDNHKEETEPEEFSSVKW